MTVLYPNLCLFVCLIFFFNSQSTIFQLSRNWSSWVQPVLSKDYCVLLKDTTQWHQRGSNPQPLDLETSTLPLSHCAPYQICVIIMCFQKHGWKFKISKILNFRKSEIKACCMHPNFKNSKFNCQIPLDKLNYIRKAIITCRIQHFEADFLWKVSLKILNSRIILKTFTHDKGILL